MQLTWNFYRTQMRMFRLSPGGSVAYRPIAKSRRREAVRIIVVGSDPGITNIVYTLFVKEFAEIYEWSDPMPEPNTGKLMRVVTKYVNLE